MLLIDCCQLMDPGTSWSLQQANSWGSEVAVRE